MNAEIRHQIPSIDAIVSDYVAGYLEHAAQQLSLGDPDDDFVLNNSAHSISTLLVSASGDFSASNVESINALVSCFIERLRASQDHAARRSNQASARKLDRAIQVGAQRGASATLGLAAAGAVDLEATSGRKVESRVDRKKLEKAERKIRAKQDRKEMKNVAYEASRLLDQPSEVQSYEDFFMQVNPLQMAGADQGKSKDVKVDGVDVSIGGQRILSDTCLTLAYGRRYGLVGQNGIGKSTLLRALSRREIAIPTHISILHVEQEITGDDTPALQAVLDADVWRKHLLGEQEASILHFSSAVSSSDRPPRKSPSSWPISKRSERQWLTDPATRSA